MGQMRFYTPHNDQLLEGAVECAYLSGLEGIPWPSRNRREGDGAFVLERAADESGCLNILTRVPGYGDLVLSTATLVEREAPYLLPVELARGTLNRLRNQAHDWHLAGLQWSESFDRQLKDATREFIRGAIQQREPTVAAVHAGNCIARSLSAMDELAVEYSQQALTCRHEREPRLPTMLASNVEPADLENGTSKSYLAAFNSAVVPLGWKTLEPNESQFDWAGVEPRLEWCRGNGLRVCGGPLLQLDQAHLPDWVYLWEEDFDNLLGCAVQYIEAAVQQLRGQVHVWHCAARLNRQGILKLSEEERLRLAVGAIQAVRTHDSQTPVLISFDQPWGEYVAREHAELSPLHFADTLIRAQLGIAGLGLELHLGYAGALTRDVLEISRLVDRWSMLGLPLLVMLTAPSGADEDPSARFPAHPRATGTGGGPTLETQRDLAERLIPLLASKPAVQGLVWSQTHDATPHEFAHGGLFDAENQPKPVLETLARIRRDHLV